MILRTRSGRAPIARALLLLLLLPAYSLTGQLDPNQAEGVQQQPATPRYSESLDVRLMTLPVLARDRQGRPITDLRAEEIRVTEGRLRYEAAFVTPFFEDEKERTELPRVRLVTQVPGRNAEISESTPREPRRLLLLADLTNDPQGGRLEAIQSLSRFLEEELDQSFQVAVMAYQGGLDLLQPFTHDRKSVATALRKIAEKRESARPTPYIRMEQFLQKVDACRIEEQDQQFDADRGVLQNRIRTTVDEQCLRDSMHEYAGEHVPRAIEFIGALDAAVRYAAGLDGHTFVLTVGGSIGMNPAREVAEAMRALFGPMHEIDKLEHQLYGEDLVRPHLERVIRRAYQENVSLSFLDRTPPPSDHSPRSNRLLEPGFRPQLVAFHAAQQDFDEIAASTGGAYVSSTEVGKGVRESMRLVEGGYYVSFYLKDDEPMTQRRIERLRLESTRPGVVLKHRRAFEGVRKDEISIPRRVRGTIQVGYAEEKELNGEVGNIIPLRLVLDPRDLGYETTEAQATAEFTVHLRLITTKGMLLADSYQVLKHSYTRDDWNSGQVQAPDLIAWADLPDGDYFAEAVVTVPSLGHRGTIRRHLIIRGAGANDEAGAPQSSDAR